MAKGNRARKSPDHLEVDSDPRARDPVIFNRLKLMVEHEACHPAWGCVLYMMHRLEQITNEQKEAGDLYQQAYYDFRRTYDLDPEVMPEELRDFWYRKIDQWKDKWKMAVHMLGSRRSAVDSIVLENNQPVGERERKAVRDGLQALAIFFGRPRNKRRT